MMRFALPGIGNNWQVLIKATALVSIIGLTDIVKLRKMQVEVPCNCSFSIVAAAIYLAITTVSNLILIWLERHYSAGVRKGQL